MRRNSDILEKTKMRSGMAMIIAIGFLVIMAGLLATMMNLTSVTTKRTEHMYFNEQAQLLAKSATEFAILAISAHDRNSTAAIKNDDCITSINTSFPGGAPYFDINTTIRYIGLDNAVASGGNCDGYIDTPFPLTGSIIAPESEGSVLIDVYVTSIDNTQPGVRVGLELGQRIRYHRRTLQKP